MKTDSDSPATGNRWWAVAEVLLIVALFFVLSGRVPPDVNEAHYLGKARHYWDPTWCPGDFFFASADAHRVFYWTFGWVAWLLPLPAAAWVGRFLTWTLLAWSWRTLSRTLVGGRLSAVWTAGWFATLMAWGQLSGEWVIGGVEAKGFAYALLFLGLAALVRGAWPRVWLCFGAAAAFHVLVGGWAVLTALLVWWLTARREHRATTQWPWLLLGGALSLPGLLPALALTWDAAAGVVDAANRIYVYERLPHHLVFHKMPVHRIVQHGLAVLVFAGLWWRVRPTGGLRRLCWFAAGALWFAMAGIGIDLATLAAPSWGARWLRYYWFRATDVAVPLGVVFLSARWLSGAALSGAARPRAGWWWGGGNRAAPQPGPVPLLCVNGALLVTLVVIGAHLVSTAWHHRRDPRPAADAQAMPNSDSPAQARRRYADWRKTCRWTAARTPPDALFLTPRYQQTFKWYAGRAEVVNWKDIPQDAASIVAWRRRMRDVYTPRVYWRGLAGLGEPRLLELADRYNFQYIVLDRTRSRRPLRFPRVFPPHDATRSMYEVYRVPPAAPTVPDA